MLKSEMRWKGDSSKQESIVSSLCMRCGIARAALRSITSLRKKTPRIVADRSMSEGIVSEIFIANFHTTQAIHYELVTHGL